jgi:branched-chain amino acid transport system substrate-binding protein
MSKPLRPAKPVSGVREPHRVAIFQDWGVGVQPIYDQYDATALAFEEATASGLLDRPVELKVVEYEGLPFGRISDARAALAELVEEWNPIALIGPHQSENIIALKPDIERWQIPTVVMSGTMAAAGPWTFMTPNGTFTDESMIMVDWLVDQGVQRLGIIREDNLLGDEYAREIRIHAKARGVAVASDIILGSFIDEADAHSAMETLQTSDAQGYVYAGFGANAFQVLDASKVAAKNGYDVPRITMSIFMGSIPGIGYGLTPDRFEGWVGVDQYDERNPAFMAMLDRFAARFDGRRPMHCYTAQGYDMGNALAHGIARAKPLSRDGVRVGLESVRRVPATAGGANNVISFGPYDHRGYKGEYITLRRVRNGDNVLEI